MERQKALDLLNSTHDFPGGFVFRVVVRPGSRASVVSAVSAAGADRLRVKDVRERASSKGTYASVHVDVEVDEAEVVLDVFAVLQSMDEVIMLL